MGLLAVARVLGCYWQQAFLWDAALRAACEIRVAVFRKVLERELGFFEGRDGGVLAGDVAYRITAEASDVADTVFALLNVSLTFSKERKIIACYNLFFAFFVRICSLIF